MKLSSVAGNARQRRAFGGLVQIDGLPTELIRRLNADGWVA
ncbi:MAG: hypothetical protein WD794_10420 [Mycobacteriales bacterium]